MAVLTCNACNKELEDEAQQKLHYRSDWHRYNLKRKVAGLPGVTEALYLARQSVLVEESNKLSVPQMVYTCVPCGKQYMSSKAHAQHLKSRSHSLKVSHGSDPLSSEITVTKPLTGCVSSKATTISKTQDSTQVESEESEDEWEEVDAKDDIEEASESLGNLHVSGLPSSCGDVSDDMVEDDLLDSSCCFICDLKHDTVENCMVHMHRQHGFFIPDIEYLKDLKGFLTYVGLKVKRDFLCLYCNDRCHSFQSLEAVRKHMLAKGHCKVHYGDGDEDEEADLEEFYDYSSSYMNVDGQQLVSQDDMSGNIELGSGGSELIISRKTENGISIHILGSREFLRYYRQKPRPSLVRDTALAISLASRYRTMGLATIQSREQILRMKVLKQMSRNGVDAMRSKIGMKSNVIRNLPKNVPY